MKNIRAIFIDFDWTIYDHNHHEIPESTIEALNEAKRKGIKLFINSARTYYSLEGQKILNLVDFDGFGIINGCASFTKDKLLHAQFLKSKDIEEIIEIAEENNLSYLVSTLGKSYIKHNNKDINVEEFYDTFLENYPLDISLYNKKDNLVAIQVFYRRDKDYLFEHLSERVRISRFFDTVVEFNKEDNYKSVATKNLMNYFSLDKDECIAIGDDINDIDMFESVTNSVCMGNGNEEAKKHASYITQSIDMDGVYKALKHFKAI